MFKNMSTKEKFVDNDETKSASETNDHENEVSNDEFTNNAVDPPPVNNVFVDIFNSIANIVTLPNILLVIWFLFIYFIIFYLIKSFYKNDTDPLNEKLAIGRGIDIFIFGGLIVFIIYSYLSLSDFDKQNMIGYSFNWIHQFYNNPNTFFNFLIFIVIFYCFIFLCGVPMTSQTRPSSIYFFEQILWIIFITILIANFFIYILGIPIIDMIFGLNGGLVNNWYKLRTKINNDISNNDITIKKKEEVFNISNNLYTYGDAQAVCRVFDSRLATIDELHEAYDEGADWCINSWSADQQALFPIQKSTYDRLQKIKGAENSCGRMGVNGGRMDDVSLRLGVNCYGIKPDASELDKTRMNNINNYIPPNSKEDIILETKVNFWKKNKDKYMVLSPFNSEEWSYN